MEATVELERAEQVLDWEQRVPARWDTGQEESLLVGEVTWQLAAAAGKLGGGWLGGI